ncbi:MAG: hypothetical protein V1249_12260, partial [Acidimicrobiales bacterium]|nr:hypothetical protein [Acidimicrobiales bacterium]
RGFARTRVGDQVVVYENPAGVEDLSFVVDGDNRTPGQQRGGDQGLQSAKASITGTMLSMSG